MAAPRPIVGAVGTAVSGTSDITVAWPSHETGDVGLLVTIRSGSDTTFSSTDWPAVTSAGIGGTGGMQLLVQYRRATSNAEPSVVVQDGGNHQLGRIITIKNCIKDGNLLGTRAPNNKTTASSLVTVPSINLTQRNSICICVVGRPDDSASTTHFGNPEAANLDFLNNEEIVQSFESGTTQGDGGGFVINVGTPTFSDRPGATGDVTMTKAVSTTDSSIFFELIGLPDRFFLTT